MVSTKTLSAREQDHSASTKPIEITSYRPPRNTSLRVGSMILVTPSSVSTREAASTTAARTSIVRASLKFSNT